MKKFVCSVCGYVYEGEAAPEKCPQCGAYMVEKGRNPVKLVCSDQQCGFVTEKKEQNQEEE